MANTPVAFGLLAFGQLEGSAPTGGFTRTFIASSDTNPVGKGDTVKDSSVAGFPNSANYVTADTSGFGQVRGVFYGCKFMNTNVGRVVWQSFFPGTAGSSLPDVEAYVVDNPQEYFLGATSSAVLIASSVVGLNIGLTVNSTPSTLDGHSNAVISSANIGSTNTLPFRVMDTYANYGPPGANGTDNTTAAVWLVVRPNNWSRMSFTAARTA
jgi:hypothetical protein